MKRETLQSLAAARAAGRPVVLLTRVATGEQELLPGDALGALDADLREMVSSALREDRSRLVASPHGDLFVHVFNPPLRMAVVGAVHISQFLVPLAAMAGYRVTVIDPRRAFATDERFPDVEVRTEWPDDALERDPPDERTAVVTLTHDPKIDDPALRAALASRAFYVGSLGSRRTHAKRLERLAEAGFSAADVDRIHGPIGLDIGASSPAEIAVAIMAQVTRVLRAR